MNLNLESKVRAIKSGLLLAGINVGKDVILAPDELENVSRQIYSTLLIPSNVDTYYYARPLTDMKLVSYIDCRTCKQRVKLSNCHWVVINESVPICDKCYLLGGY